MLPGEVRDQAAQRLDGLRGHRRDLDPARLQAAHRFHTGPRGFDAADHVTGGPDQCPPGVGQHETAADPVEQVAAQMAFERPDRL